MYLSIPVVSNFSLPPDSAGTVRAVARIGYELREALADIIDNSIDAHARKVIVTFIRDDERVLAVLIADDGHGMNAAALERAMQFGVRVHHEETDLGTFGLGLKSASLSQCRSLTVVSRCTERVAACRWTTEAIGKDWSCARLDPSAASTLFADGYSGTAPVPSAGTLVVWDELQRLGVPQGNIDRFLGKIFQDLELHLGLHFHRFLARGSMEIILKARHVIAGPAIPHSVQALDPFEYPHSGHSNFPKTFVTTLPGTGDLRLTAHIWPANTNSPNFRLGRRNPTGYQGLYFYRNDRLVQAGGWNGFLKDVTDAELSLARVSINLPPSGAPTINVQKSALQVSAGLFETLRDARCGALSLDTYLDHARRVFRQASRLPRRARHIPLVPGEGLPAALQRSLKEFVGHGSKIVRPISFAWSTLPRKQMFEVHAEGDVVYLNKRYRSRILEGRRASAADAPFIKVLLFLLLRQEFDRERFSAKRREWLEVCNRILQKAVMTL